MKDIQTIIRSSSNLDILKHFESHEYLKQSLPKVSSSSYYIKWGRYFLAESQLTDDDEKAKYKKRLGSYVDALRNDDNHFTNVLQELDYILDAFDNKNGHDELRLLFINRMIDLCVEKGISFYLLYIIFSTILFRPTSFY